MKIILFVNRKCYIYVNFFHVQYKTERTHILCILSGYGARVSAFSPAVSAKRALRRRALHFRRKKKSISVLSPGFKKPYAHYYHFFAGTSIHFPLFNGWKEDPASRLPRPAPSPSRIQARCYAFLRTSGLSATRGLCLYL